MGLIGGLPCSHGLGGRGGVGRGAVPMQRSMKRQFIENRRSWRCVARRNVQLAPLTWVPVRAAGLRVSAKVETSIFPRACFHEAVVSRACGRPNRRVSGASLAEHELGLARGFAMAFVSRELF